MLRMEVFDHPTRMVTLSEHREPKGLSLNLMTRAVTSVGGSPLLFTLRHEGQQGELDFSPAEERLSLKWASAPGFLDARR
jgi:hypothetical protein